MAASKVPVTPNDSVPKATVEASPFGKSNEHMPPLSAAEWIVFAFLAAVVAAFNIYTTLLIGWGDGGSIIAVLASVLILGLISKKKPSVHTLNLGQTMVSAGGSVGFAVATYAAVRIVKPDFDPPVPVLMTMFAAMGMLGTIVGSSVRKYMVHYFFPSGTACAVILRSVAADRAPGERNRPVFLLALWGTIAAAISIPTKIALKAGGAAIRGPIELWQEKGIAIGVDPLYYGIGIVVGPRIGLGMIIGGLAPAFLIQPWWEGAGDPVGLGDWIKWIAIAILTLPTFATIIFAYLFRSPVIIPTGFTPGKTNYETPSNRTVTYAVIGVLSALALGFCVDYVFALPWHVTILTIAVAWPLCVMNGRVTGDTDINPVRLVAIVLLTGFAWMISSGAIAMLGMAVIGGTIAAVAVDMMQDYRTGYLVDANPNHQTTVQLFGVVAGALAAIPFFNLLVGHFGVGEGTALAAPGAQIWATMASAFANGMPSSNLLYVVVAIISVIGSGYAFLTVWPRTARFMPSIFGIGIGLLLPVEASAAIFLGGCIKWVATMFYTKDKSLEDRPIAAENAANDTMLVGSSVFAAGAVMSIALIVITIAMGWAGLDWFFLAS